jgi:hypothetical protein
VRRSVPGFAYHKVEAFAGMGVAPPGEC